MRHFSQEARAASALNHPNLITVHDAREFEDGPLLVMELVEGESLRALLLRGPLPLAKVLDIGIQVATALTHASQHLPDSRAVKRETSKELDRVPLVSPFGSAAEDSHALLR